jgi:hypothetical protein
MHTIVKQWARTVAIGDLLKRTHLSLITSDRRILNTYEKHAAKGVQAFILRADRLKMHGWGKTSEAKLERDLSLYILRELLKQHDPKKEFLANHEMESETFAAIKDMEYAALEALFKVTHNTWWKAIEARNRCDIHMVKVANFLGIKWPEKYGTRKIADYRFPSAHKTLNIEKFGQKKLHSLLLVLAWAALSEEEIPELSEASPEEAMNLAKLSIEEKAILEERFDKKKTLEKVGEAYSRSRQRALQIQTKAIGKIKALKLDIPVQKWLLEQADMIWAQLSKDNGESVESMGDSRKAYRAIPGDIELALAITDMSLDQVLRRVGEQVGEIWIKRKNLPTTQPIHAISE